MTLPVTKSMSTQRVHAQDAQGQVLRVAHLGSRPPEAPPFGVPPRAAGLWLKVARETGRPLMSLWTGSAQSCQGSAG